MLMYQLNIDEVFRVIDVLFKLKEGKQIRPLLSLITAPNQIKDMLEIWHSTDVSLLRVLSMTTK